MTAAEPTDSPFVKVSTQELEMRYLLIKSMQLGMVDSMVEPGIKKLLRTDKKGLEKNSRLLELSRFVMEKTAIKVFFGGVGKEQNIDTAKQLIDSYIGTIIDNAAPENSAGSSTSDERYARAMKGYDKALDICEELMKFYQDDPVKQRMVSAAFKFSTVAEFTYLEAISSDLKKAENTDKPWGQKHLHEQTEGWMQDIYQRAKPFFERAQKLGIEAYADAEQSGVNPAIVELCARLRQDGMRPTVTVQAYLKDADQLVDQLLAMDPPPNIKLVRGAYLKNKEDNTVSNLEHRFNIWENKELTDACYNRLLEKLYDSQKIETLTVATHNQESRRVAENLVKRSAGHNPTRMVFATLMGIDSNLSKPASELAIEERKYQPALLDETTPAVLGAIAYFARRANEFMSVPDPSLGKTRAELELAEITEELKHRDWKDKRRSLTGMAREIAAGALHSVLHGAGMPAKS